MHSEEAVPSLNHLQPTVAQQGDVENTGSHHRGAPPRRPLEELEKSIGYSFKRREFLLNALVHRSYLHDVPEFTLESNERLEFLGDAILGFLVSSDLFKSQPDKDEGQLSSLRGALVRLKTLAELGAALDIGEYLYMSYGEEAAGGRTRGTNIGRAVEALLGAAYLDGSLRAAKTVWSHIKGKHSMEQLEEVLSGDYKSLLQQFTQARMKQTPYYHLVETMGPDHARQFRVEVETGGRPLANAIGSNKKIAEQAAAQKALALLTTEAQGEEQGDAEGMESDKSEGEGK
ncbi:MAG: ribonuclease III [Chloroflexota bacterium]|nr:ribonuclease III [Chloroflexota bacterium]